MSEIDWRRCLLTQTRKRPPNLPSKLELEDGVGVGVGVGVGRWDCVGVWVVVVLVSLVVDC